MIEILKESGYSAQMTSAITKEIITLVLIAFVDDTEIFLTDPNNDPSQLIQTSEAAINTWRETLQITGGAMRAKKCGWTMAVFNAKGDLDPTHTPSGDIFIPEEDGSIKQVARYDPSEAREYLGVFQTPHGDETAQIEKLFSKIGSWNSKVAKSKLLPLFNLNALLTRIYKTLEYPLSALTITYKEYIKLSNKLTTTTLPKCSVACTFPENFRYLPSTYQGLHLPDLYIKQESEKIMILLSHGYTDSILWDQINYGMQIMQTKAGVNTCIFNSSYQKYSPLLLSSTWLSSVWKYVQTYNLHIKGWKQPSICNAITIVA